MKITQLAQEYIYWPELNSPSKKNIDFSHTSLVDMSNEFSTLVENSKINVTNEIIKFYALNEVLAKVRQKENDILSLQAIELYKLYEKNIDVQSKNMFAYITLICCMEARHNKDYREIRRTKESFGNNLNPYSSLEEVEVEKAKYEQEAQQIKDKILKKRIENNLDINSEKFSLIFEAIEGISEVSSYDRNTVSTGLLDIFKEERFRDITLKDLLEVLVIIYQECPFESGYGGNAWKNIAQHGLNFATGTINAEVFLDQSFSLEHNGGNIFNKDIIFDSPSNFYFKTTELENYSKHSSYEGYSSTSAQVCLNAQHKGQLLSLLKADFNLVPYDNYDPPEILPEIKKLKLIDEKTDSNNFEYLCNEFFQNNFNYLKNIQTSFTTNFKDIFEFIKIFNVDIPDFDLSSVIEHLSLGDKRYLRIEDSERPFYALSQHLTTMYNKSPIVGKGNYEYKFGYLETDSITEDKFDKVLLGNKAYNLAAMHRIDLPVPKSVVFTTDNAASFFHDRSKWIADLRPQINKVLLSFRDNNGIVTPFSVRSGSSVSMPGMMDTILNVGIDDTNYEYLCEKMTKKVVDESVIKFMKLFSTSLLDEHVEYSTNLPKALFQFKEVLYRHKIPQNFDKMFPLNARQQVKWSLQAVFSSWNSDRAQVYRKHHGISDDIGTAAIVQQMVFGNLNEQSCTGVVFSRDCINGKSGIIGEFLPKAQGEDVVSGAVTPLNISEMKAFNPRAYQQLTEICEDLERQTGDIQDIEFTIEDGELYILQKRKAVCSPIAQIHLNQELYDNGLISEEKFIKSLSIDVFSNREYIETTNKPVLQGLVGNPGIKQGIVVYNEEDMIKHAETYYNMKSKDFGWIFYAPQTSPEHAGIMLKTDAFITSNGGFTSHAAILSRSWDKPCVVGVGDNNIPQPGDIITIDANNGLVFTGKEPVLIRSEKDTQKMIDKILGFYKVEMIDIETTDTLNQVVEDINKEKLWTEQYANVTVENKTEFLNIGKKLAMLITKTQNLEKTEETPIVPAPSLAATKPYWY